MSEKLTALRTFFPERASFKGFVVRERHFGGKSGLI